MFRKIFLLLFFFLESTLIIVIGFQPASAYAEQLPCINIPATPDYLSSGNPRDAIGAINNARQQEHIHPLKLPGNFYQLSLVQQQFKLVNAERVDRGLRPLILGAVLSQMAQSYSQQMETQHFIGHTSPDGTTFAQRINKNPSVRNHYSMAAENIAANPIAGAGVVYEYMYNDAASGCGHRSSILTPQLTHIGIGVVSDMTYGTLSVQDFIASACWNPYKG